MIKFKYGRMCIKMHWSNSPKLELLHSEQNKIKTQKETQQHPHSRLQTLLQLILQWQVLILHTKDIVGILILSPEYTNQFELNYYARV